MVKFGYIKMLVCIIKISVFVLVIAHSVSIVDASQCNLLDSVPIEGNYIKMSNGQLLYERVVYRRDQLMNSTEIVQNGLEVDAPMHLRGCLCDIEKCIRLCCPVGFVYDGGNCTKFRGQHFNVNVNVSGESGQLKMVDLVTDSSYRQRLVASKPCKQMYLLENLDITDEFIFFENGMLEMKIDKSLLDHQHYCISVQLAPNRTDLLVNSFLRCFESGSEEVVKNYLYPISMLCSVPFLVATFLVYALIPELHGNNHGKSLMFYVFGLAIAYVCLATSKLLSGVSVNETACMVLGYITYFFVLFCFFWSNVMCIDIFLTFRGIRRTALNSSLKKKFIYYMFYACLAPLLMAGFVQLIDREVIHVPENWRPNIGRDRCFITKNTNIELVFLYVPMACLLTANLVLFILTALRIRQVRNAATSATSDSHRHSRLNDDTDRFILYVRLFIVMGITWITEVVSWAVDIKWIWFFYFTDICNCIQGIIIFFLFVWKVKVRKLIAKKFNSVVSSKTNSTQSTD